MFEWIKFAAQVLFDRSARKRFVGLRPVALCIVQSHRRDPSRFLMIRPTANEDVWVPPQEGIEVGETVDLAAMRCMRDELGLPVEKLQYRKSAYVGDRLLPDRIGDRDLRYAICRMRGKAYFAALVIADSDAPLTANPAEVAQHRWLSLEEVSELVACEQVDKRELVRSAFRSLLAIELPGS